MYSTWTLKYKPKSLSEIVGNTSAINLFKDWVKSWDTAVPKQRAAFLYGPSGIGKTVTVEALANDLKMEFTEKNASDYRTEEAINKFAGLASRYDSLFGVKRLILLDELDGLTGNADRGGIKAITEIAKKAQVPIVLIANNAYDSRFTTLRNYCLLIEFKKLTTVEVLKYLTRLCSKEEIHAEENALKLIAHRSGGDVRSAVNDLQALAQGKKQLKYEDVAWLSYRDRQDTIFNVVRMAMYSRTCSVAKQSVDLADIDIDMLFEWIYENIPYHFTDPRDLVKAMESLAMADLYRGKIRATQDWSFLRYVIDYMTAGVCMARQYSKVGWVPFKFPTRIQSLSRSKAERALQLSIGAKIKPKFHISAKRSLTEVLPFIRVIFRNNPQKAADIARWLDLTEEMVIHLAGTEEKAKAITALLA